MTCDLGSLATGAPNDVTVTVVVTPGPGRGAEHHEHGNGSSLRPPIRAPRTTKRAPRRRATRPVCGSLARQGRLAGPRRGSAATSPTRSPWYNAGPDPANDTTVSDPLPAGLVLVSVPSTSQGTCFGHDDNRLRDRDGRRGHRQRRHGHDRRDCRAQRGGPKHHEQVRPPRPRRPTPAPRTISRAPTRPWTGRSGRRSPAQQD